MSRVIIAGDRHETDRNFVFWCIARAMEAGVQITEVVSGGARGVDALGEAWAVYAGRPVTVFKADWERYGRAAGPIRNAAMCAHADVLIAIHRNLSVSRGTRDVITKAHAAGLRVFVFDGREGKEE